LEYAIEYLVLHYVNSIFFDCYNRLTACVNAQIKSQIVIAFNNEIVLCNIFC